jgi:hypothetical protein
VLEVLALEGLLVHVKQTHAEQWRPAFLQEHLVVLQLEVGPQLQHGMGTEGGLGTATAGAVGEVMGVSTVCGAPGLGTDAGLDMVGPRWEWAAS